MALQSHAMVPNPDGQPVPNLMEQIQGTHAPDDREVDVKPLVNVVADILNRTTSGIEGLAHAQAHLKDALDDKATHGDSVGLPEELANTIRRLFEEIQSMCTGGGDAHTTTLALFSKLSRYAWDAKVVFALAAFGVKYGEFWYWLRPTNHLAKSIALLKKLPDIFEHYESLRLGFEALTNAVKEMLAVTKCIVEFQELSISLQDTPVMKMAFTLHIPTAVYWTLRSVVACTRQLVNLICLGHESTTELSSLVHELNNIHDQLREQIALCHQHIDGRRDIDAYPKLVRLMEAEQTDHTGNMKILRALINSRDDILPLFDGLTKNGIGLEILRGKETLLLISDLDISTEELFMLEKMYSESRHQPTSPKKIYEEVWLPVVDRSTPWTEEKQKQFEYLQNSMPWYSVHHPSMVDLAVIKYIKEKWKFAKKPILVVLDPQGRVANQNALHMIWIWGSFAFPFTSMREDALWREETWRLELLVDGIDQNILNWISEGRLICLYGGEDMEWIRKFTVAARAVSQVIRKPIELVYVGKSNQKERVRNNITSITSENLSHTWPDLTAIWFFWVRLESMWYSKMQNGKTTENDMVMKEIMTILRFDDSAQGWAVVSRGSTEMAKANGETMLTSFMEIDQWVEYVKRKGFIPALNDQLHTPHQCIPLILPATTGSILDMIVCAECGRAMDKYIMYSCCTETESSPTSN